MITKLKINYKNGFELVFWIVSMFVTLFNSNSFDESLFPICIIFVFFNILMSFLSSDVILSIPVIVIQITGVIRFLFIPYIMKQEGISFLSSSLEFMKWLVSLEMLGTYVGLRCYNYKRTIRREANISEDGKDDNINKNLNTKFGLSVIILLGVGGVVVFTNQSLLSRYFSLSGNLFTAVTNVSGLMGLVASTFFLLLFILAIQTISNIAFLSDLLKVLISIILSVFFVKGTSITGVNVSRWTMLISAFIAFIYVSRLYPSYKKGLMIILISVAVFAVTTGTMMKFGETHRTGYGSINETLKTITTYKSVNSYFSGPRNMEVGIKMLEALPKGIWNTGSRFVSDIFANFPLLNHYFSDESIQTMNIFNLQIYGSTIARDQIVPCSVQFYSYLGGFFFILQAFLIYFALMFYEKLRYERDFLSIYCMVYLSMWPCLYNCINLSVMLQNLWIHVLPVFVVCVFNKRIVRKI